MGSISYALAGGNAVVFKPSEYTPAVGAWLVDDVHGGVGEEPVVQLLTGVGDTGAALCAHPGIDVLAFTGSAATGRSVMAACAQNLTKVVMECGGKDAMIVAADADLDQAAEAALWGGVRQRRADLRRRRARLRRGRRLRRVRRRRDRAAPRSCRPASTTDAR